MASVVSRTVEQETSSVPALAGNLPKMGWLILVVLSGEMQLRLSTDLKSDY